MKIYTIITLILLSLITCFLFSEEVKADFKEYIMPKNLTYTSLPDDYDKRIEDYFQYFYRFMMAQDPNLSRIENEEACNKFINSLSDEEITRLSFSKWLFMNKYYDYYKEYHLINNTFYKSHFNTSPLLINSILFHFLKLNTNQQNTTIFGESYFSRMLIMKLSKSDTFNNDISQTIHLLWIVGRIESYEIIKSDYSSFISLTISVKKSLGGNFFQKEKMIILLNDTLTDNLDKDTFSLDSLNLSINQDYLIPVNLSIRNFLQPTDINRCKSLDDLCKSISHTATILIIKDNKISKNNVVQKFKGEDYTLSGIKNYDFFFKSEESTITLDYADIKLKALLKIKN